MKMIFINFWTLPAIIFLVFVVNANGENNLDFCTNKSFASRLVGLIEDLEESAKTYQPPENARQYATDDSSITDFGTFDFIIIGAGSGGTVIANRLTEVPHWKVLLLEAGDFGNCLTNIPNMLLTMGFTSYNWGFMNTPQKTSCLGMVGNVCPIFRGKGVGGSTLVNALVYARGSSIDFDRWAEHVNDTRWSYDEVLQYFKKSENFTHRDKMAPVYEPAHGKNGYFHVEYHRPRSPQFDTFLKANEDLGLPIADYNAHTGLGASPLQRNTKDGSRYDGGKAFIFPVLNRKNLVVLPNSYATKILIHQENKTAYGVAFNHNNKRYFATAEKEVIVSAGSISTPHLLMLSGIGPKTHLEEVNVTVIQDLEVGSTLRDHPSFIGLTFGTNYTEPAKSLEESVGEYINGYGPLTSGLNIQGVGFYESQFTRGTGYPDIGIMLHPANATNNVWQKAFNVKDTVYEDIWKNNNISKTFAMDVVTLHAESTGTVRLKNNDPFQYPIIDTNQLSDKKNKDIDTIYEGIQIALKLSTTPSLRKLDTKLQGGPLRACKQHKYRSKKYWYCAIRQMTTHLQHLVGTCPMGQFPEKGDVVNSKLQVHGVGKLRIGDASVFPFTLAGYPNAPTVMVGEVLSDLLKGDYL